MVDYKSGNPSDFFTRHQRFENVFIIGAGFSKAVNLPLTPELLPQCLEFCTNKRYESFHKNHPWLQEYPDRLKEVCGWFYGPDSSQAKALDVEALLTDIESYRKLAELAVPGGPNERIIDLFKYTARLIALFLNQRMTESLEITRCNVDKVDKLLATCRERSTFISLNYDLVLEWLGMGEAFNYVNWDHLIKLHGSTDLWLQSKPFPEMPNTVRVLGNAHFPGLDSLGPNQRLIRIEYHSRRASHTDLDTGTNDYPIIIPPVQGKDFTRCEPYFKHQTKKAIHAIVRAKRIVLIGCALNSIDKHFLSVIRLGTYSRASEPALREQLPLWHVFDRSEAPVKQLKKEFGITAKHHPGDWTDNFEALLQIVEKK